MANNTDDPVKKIFGKSAEEMRTERKDKHSKYHSDNAFCDNAGPEEFKHFHYLLDQLTDSEVAELTKRVGIKFGGVKVGRVDNEGVLDEADREDFYREYHKLLEERS